MDGRWLLWARCLSGMRPTTRRKSSTTNTRPQHVTSPWAQAGPPVVSHAIIQEGSLKAVTNRSVGNGDPPFLIAASSPVFGLIGPAGHCFTGQVVWLTHPA